MSGKYNSAFKIPLEIMAFGGSCTLTTPSAEKNIFKRKIKLKNNIYPFFSKNTTA
jgi:hypothetical protein